MLSFQSGTPIAKIKGGKLNGRIIYSIDTDTQCCNRHSNNCEISYQCCKKCPYVNDMTTKIKISDGSLTPLPNVYERGVDYIAGPSGSGKSTLMNIIGLLDRPTHGSYVLNGRSVSRLRSNQRAKVRRDTVGFVFQSFNLLSRATVYENVELPLMYAPIPRAARKAKVVAAVKSVGLFEKLKIANQKIQEIKAPEPFVL